MFEHVEDVLPMGRCDVDIVVGYVEFLCIVVAFGGDFDVGLYVGWYELH